MSSAERKKRSEHIDEHRSETLPPRAERREQRQRQKKSATFPLATVLLVVFLGLVGLAIFLGGAR
ncbi:hypothetical protein ACI2JA_10485 [Alkalihalobacillus sp. NPDC078783]